MKSVVSPLSSFYGSKDQLLCFMANTVYFYSSTYQLSLLFGREEPSTLWHHISTSYPLCPSGALIETSVIFPFMQTCFKLSYIPWICFTIGHFMYDRSRLTCAVSSPVMDFADFVDIDAMALWNPFSFKLVKAVSKTQPLKLCKSQKKFFKLIEVCWRIYAPVNGVNIGVANGLSPIRCEAITWINADLLSSKSSETNSSKI